MSKAGNRLTELQGRASVLGLLNPRLWALVQGQKNVRFAHGVLAAIEVVEAEQFKLADAISEARAGVEAYEHDAAAIIELCDKYLDEVFKGDATIEAVKRKGNGLRTVIRQWQGAQGDQW